MRDILNWLPAWQRIEYRMAALVWRCLLGLALAYFVEFCGPTQSARSSLSLRSADQGLLRVPFARTRHLRHAETCLCSGWPFNLEWPPFVDPHTP